MLKKYILSFVAASLFLASAYSQNSSNIRLGITVSPNISWLKSDVSRIQGDGSRFGFNIGLVVDKYFAEHYAFTTGLSIHSLGGKLKYRDEKILHTSSSEDPTLPPGTSVQYNLQYLHIPWGLKFKTTEIGYLTFFGQLGVNTLINIKARADVKERDISGAGVSEEINIFYMGYHIGGGIEYKIVGNTAIVAGISYMNGFTDITQKSDEKTVLHGFEIRLGVLF